jgi:hypothetical protein
VGVTHAMVDEEQVRAAVAAAHCVVPTGAGTHRDVGNPVVEESVAVGAPAGIEAYDPAELTVTAWAGTTVGDLDATLAAAGQECAIDPRDPTATVGGTIAAGLSGYRRLRYGPLRDRVLEVRFVTGDARVVRGGGPTVKNVTGYDLPRDARCHHPGDPAVPTASRALGVVRRARSRVGARTVLPPVGDRVAGLRRVPRAARRARGRPRGGVRSSGVGAGRASCVARGTPPGAHLRRAPTVAGSRPRARSRRGRLVGGGVGSGDGARRDRVRSGARAGARSRRELRRLALA